MMFSSHARSVFFALLFLILFGCATAPDKGNTLQDAPVFNLQKEIEDESRQLSDVYRNLQDSLEKKSEEQVALEPVRPTYDPLEDHIISFSVVNEDFQTMLYSLSKAVKMNLILDPTIKKEDQNLTLNFENVSAARVLKEILDGYDLYYELDAQVIRIKPFQERIFYLNFLDSEVNSSFDVGGDVLGVGETEAAGGLSGSFRLSGRGTGRGNAYDLAENMVKRMISGGGKYALNRMSGSLYVKDTPGVLRSISKLVNHFRQMLSRQILIEARIIEVSLSDNHKYGIDWGIIRDSAADISTLSQANWSYGSGLILGHEKGQYALSAAIDALQTFGDAKVISNPTIRSKHGRPAIISVGTSFTYKKSVETTSSSTATEESETTQVEVSTVFDGLILGVIPFIEENNSISLLINPIKSDVDRSSLEPELVANNSGQSISLPEVSIKEISTTISLHNNDVVMLGGLIDKRKSSEKKSVPIISSIPILGYLFKDDIEVEETRELVIILTVSIT
ncbi:MAG: pilus (MSHA type) biogenesis protein MshL [Desulfobacteraceae bacterium]|jgi:MSHA type pilus biogenesis protein MshL